MSAVDAGQAEETLSDLDLTLHDLERGPVQVPATSAYYLDAQVDDEAKDEGFRAYVDGLRVVDPQTYAVPASLAEVLRPYQVEGFRWLNAVCDKGFGGILADEMGLGKTVQLLSLLVARRDEARTVGPNLIVCPASLVYNWEAECRRFAPGLRVAVVAGSKAKRRALLDRICRTQTARGAAFDEGSVLRRVRAWASVLTPVVVGLFRRADRVAESMDARLYGSSARRGPRPS